MKKLKKAAAVALGGAGIVALGCIFYFFAATAGVKLDREKLAAANENIVLYDANGDAVTECAANGQNVVPYSEIPPHTVRAFLAAEDKHFFSHGGFDYGRMAMALLKNTVSFSFKEGASTISQQLVKNTQLTPEKTIRRKLKEFRLTRELEKNYSKEEIMEAYLNTIYFGHSCYGLKSAAYFYFGVEPAHLSVGQSAVLAGIIKSPNNYSPLKSPQNCLKRRNSVLRAMEENGFITPAERAQAEKEALPSKGNRINSSAQSYYDAVLDELDDVLGENVYSKRNVYTYLDVKLQKELEKQAQNTDFDKSFCVIDNRLHGVKAFFSTIGRAKRLPGSTLKPLLVYAPALQENLISPATPILDEKIDFNGYSPDNYDDSFHGYVSAREALCQSYNVPAVKILNALGVEKGAAYLEKLGLPVTEEDSSLALALGGMAHGYALTDLCAGYACFANEGYYYPCNFIEKITDERGKTLFQRQTTGQKVFDEESVTLLNDMLQTTAKTGTAKKLSGLPFDVCAKTGTCGKKTGNTDAYCIAYTSQDTVGVWLGSAENETQKNLTGGGAPTNINAAIQNYLYQNAAPLPLPRSENVAEYALDKTEYDNNHKLVLCDANAPIQAKTLKELFKKNAAPRETSTYFSRPTLGAPTVTVNNLGVCIDLCQAEYLSIIINRQDKNGYSTIYRGKMIQKFVDPAVKSGERYVYSVTPYYDRFVGQTVVLPQVYIP